MSGEQAIVQGPVPGAMASTARSAAARDGTAPAPVSAARRLCSALLVAATLFLVYAGAEVKSRQAGLAVPDWPLSFGMLMPPMVANVFYEHGHRMVAAAVGLATLLLVVWTLRTERRAWVRRLSVGTLAAVVAQGLLGGLTVVLLLPPPVSIGHALLAQTFLCLVAWQAFAVSHEGRGPAVAPVAGPAATRALRGAAWATGATYAQLFLGALMRHTESGLAVPFFPVSADGALVPEPVTGRVWIHMAHRVFAVVVLAAVLASAWRAARTVPRLRGHALLMTALVVAQVLLGATVIWTAGHDVADGVTPVVSPVPASLHVVTGAALLVAAWLLALRLHRLGQAASRAHVPARAGAAA
jgi:cytochrome c oxidase assembly protein subunit 15